MYKRDRAGYSTGMRWKVRQPDYGYLFYRRRRRDKNNTGNVKEQLTAAFCKNFEYDAHIALDDGRMEGNVLKVKFPDSAVLSLRAGKRVPENGFGMVMVNNCQNSCKMQKICYNVSRKDYE